jgi:hypothetical protein
VKWPSLTVLYKCVRYNEPRDEMKINQQIANRQLGWRAQRIGEQRLFPR